jgi:hypothetical protein
MMTLPVSSLHSLPASAPSRSSHHASHRACRCVPYVTDARAAAATHSPGLSSLPGGHCYPLRSSPRWDGFLLSQGRGSDHDAWPSGTYLFWNILRNVKGVYVTATSGPCNGPRGAGCAAGDEEPATKSRASTYQQFPFFSPFSMDLSANSGLMPENCAWC